MDMTVSIKNHYTVKPATQTWRGRIPLTELDQVGIISHVPIIYFYKLSSPDSIINILRGSLSQILVPFYPLAGRLCLLGRGRMELDCNSDGALLVDAESKLRLDFSVPDFSSLSRSLAPHLLPRIDYRRVPLPEIPILLVQHTKFNCGAISVAVGISHTVADGRSVFHFISEWARVTRGEPVRVMPRFNDAEILRIINPYDSDPWQDPDKNFSSDPPILLFDPDSTHSSIDKTTEATMILTKNKVANLKIMANSDSNLNFSRYESIAAHIWRCACKARFQKPDDPTGLAVCIDIRNRLRQPALPQSYFGNAAFDFVVKSTVGEIISNPLTFATSKIRETVKKVTNEYVRYAIGYLKNQPDLTMFQDSLKALKRSDIVGVLSWLTFPSHDFDFVWGKVEFAEPGDRDFDGDCVILPGPENDESIVVRVRLQVTHMEAFKKYFHEDIHAAAYADRTGFKKRSSL
ncbi:spermidine hydroxycinnamoyl transferase [Carica papaya]|uniref:spermidine hydroxycinnamoyl transferase n=1 Tax=Carica papaya TaxID=3649 RepID=UPI000B8D1079|nr:spermidine hydroxycinnamoyl transferase [Carica papaya]